MQCSIVVVDCKHAESFTANELNSVLQITATHLEQTLCVFPLWFCDLAVLVYRLDFILACD